jgi:hypothetical protein
MDEFLALMDELNASQAGMTLRSDCEDEKSAQRDRQAPDADADDGASEDFAWRIKIAEPRAGESQSSMSYSINNITAKEEARSRTAAHTRAHSTPKPRVRCTAHYGDSLHAGADGLPTRRRSAQQHALPTGTGCAGGRNGGHEARPFPCRSEKQTLGYWTIS